MNITTGTLYLIFAIFLNSLELISSVKPTLKQLFPGYDGIDLPPIEEIRPEDTRRYVNFRTLENQQMSIPNANFLKRGHIIFAFRVGYLSKPLNNLFGERLISKFMVFDINKDEWVTLRKHHFSRLGANQSINLIRARDQAAATQNLNYRRTHPVNDEASLKIHKEASEAAYEAAGTAEGYYRKTRWGQTTDAADYVQQKYNEEYNHTYQCLLGRL